MYKGNTKLVVLVGTLALLTYDVYGLIEPIPLPHTLSQCFKTQTEKTAIRDLAGEEIYTLCMFEWEIAFAKNHSCQKYETKATNGHSYRPSLSPPKYKSRKPSKRKRNRHRRHIKPEQILHELMRDFKENKNKNRRKRWNRRKLRKEYRMLTDTERGRYHRAVNLLKNSNHQINYDYLSLFHQGETLGKAHGGPNFPGWHRVYLIYYELLLDYHVPGVSLPYWDSSIDKHLPDPSKSIIWTEKFMGTGNGIITTGPFKNWRTAYNNTRLIRNVPNNGERLISSETVDLILSQPSHEFILIPTSPDLEANLEMKHGGPHAFIGGHMGRLITAAMDPMFFMHHAYIDYIWEKFRERISNNVNPETDYPDSTPFNSLNERGQGPYQEMPNFPGLRNIDGYSNFWTEFYYHYQDSPTCSDSKQCGSPYYECLSHINRCTSVTEATVKVSAAAANSVVEMTALAADPPQMIKGFQKLSHKNPVSSYSAADFRLAFDRDNQASCLGEPIQNTFGIDCVCDVDRWAFIAVKIVHLRADHTRYNEQIIRNGEVQGGNDMFSPENYQKLKSLVSHGEPGRYSDCPQLKSGASRIFIQSQGLSYDGEYKDYAFIDEREPISSTIAYIAVKKPIDGDVTAYIAAIDSCGRLCKARCLDKGSNPPKYVPCSGAIRVTSKKPLMYGKTFGDAILDLWNLDDPSAVPLPTREEIFLLFYCDYKDTWPWEESNDETLH